MRSILTIDAIRGRNGVDSPVLLDNDQCVEAFDVEWSSVGLATKRAGGSSVGLTFSAGGPFVHPIRTLFRHVPSNDESQSQLWAIDSATPPQIGVLSSGTTWSEVISIADDFDADYVQFVNACSFNGKTFIAGATSVDRLHVFDGTTLRRVGLATPGAAPTVANTGSGSYTATPRYYKVTFAHYTGSICDRRSEASASVSFTPSGSGTAARITRPTSISEGETDWEVWGSADGTYYYLLTHVAIGTSTYDDSATPSAYSGTAIPLVGANVPPVSVKYVATNGNRLLMAGAWGGTNYSRVWFTPPLGASDVGDDERIPNTVDGKNWIDLDENDGGAITGIVGQFLGDTLVFKQRQFWKLVPTGSLTAPYAAVKLSNTIGAVSHKSIVEGEDENGNPALYFLSMRGPYRYTSNGLQYCGHDVEDVWKMQTQDTVTLGTSLANAHGVYDTSRGHVIWFIPPAYHVNWACLVLHVRFVRTTVFGLQGGWVRWSIPYAHTPYASTMYGCITTASGTSAYLVPYVFYYAVLHGVPSPHLLKFDSQSLMDGSSTYQAYVTTKMYPLEGLGRNFSVREGSIVGHDTGGEYTLSVACSGSLGDTNTSTVTFDSATTTIKSLESTAYNQTAWLQFTIGDVSSQASAWRVDAIAVPYRPQEDRR